MFFKKRKTEKELRKEIKELNERYAKDVNTLIKERDLAEENISKQKESLLTYNNLLSEATEIMNEKRELIKKLIELIDYFCIEILKVSKNHPTKKLVKLIGVKLNELGK